MAAAGQRERVEVVPGPITILLCGNIKAAGEWQEIQNWRDSTSSILHFRAVFVETEVLGPTDEVIHCGFQNGL